MMDHKIKVVVRELNLRSIDDFVYFEDYLSYLLSKKEEAVEGLSGKIYLTLDYEYNYADCKDYTIVVQREESDEEFELRLAAQKQKDLSEGERKRLEEIKLLQKLKEKYPEH